jgi:branched-chain amino acid transport system substrate-binding protein
MWAGVPPVEPQQPKKGEIKIGFISALSGAGIGWGMGMLGGLELAAEDVNNAGGIRIGDTVNTIKVIAYDDKYTGPGAVQAAQPTYLAGRRPIIGAARLGAMLAIADVTEGNKVLVLSNSYEQGAERQEALHLPPLRRRRSSAPLIG